MQKIIGNRLSEVYDTTTNNHTKKIIENAIGIAKSSNLSADQTIPILEKSLQCQRGKDKIVDNYYAGIQNLAVVRNMGITEAITELKALPIFNGNTKFKTMVTHFEDIKEHQSVHDHRMISSFMENLQEYKWNKSVKKISSLMEAKLHDSMPYVMVANVFELLKAHEPNPTYELVFKRLSTAMALPANMVGKYVIQALSEYKFIPEVAEMVQAFVLMEKSWMSRTLPHATSVITSMGRFKLTGLTAPTTKMQDVSIDKIEQPVKEQKMLMIKNRLYLNNGKAIQEVRNSKRLPNSYKKLYENMMNPCICMGDDMDVCATENGHQICIKFGDMIATNGDANSIYFTVDGVKYDTTEAAITQMSTIGISDETMNSLLDIYAYAYAESNNIEMVDNAMIMQDEVNLGCSTIVLIIEPNNISIIVIDESLNESKVFNNMNAIQANSYITEHFAYPLVSSPIGKLIREGIEEMENKIGATGADVDLRKKEMIDIEEMIARIENLGDGAKADPEIQEYYQELLVRRSKVRQAISDAESTMNSSLNPDMATPEGISNAIYNAFEELREKIGILKTTDIDTTQINGAKIQIGNEFTATPIIKLNGTEHDLIDGLALKITGPDGNDEGIASAINQKFKEFGVSVISGNELALNCLGGQLNNPFGEDLKASISSVISRLYGSENVDNDIPDDDVLSDEGDDENKPPKEGEEEGNKKPPFGDDKDKGAKPGADDKSPKIDDHPQPTKFEGKIKHDKEELMTKAQAQDPKMAEVITGALSGESLAQTDAKLIEATVTFLTNNDELELADYVKSSAANDDEEAESEFKKKEKEREKAIASTRTADGSTTSEGKQRRGIKEELSYDDWIGLRGGIEEMYPGGTELTTAQIEDVIQSYGFKFDIDDAVDCLAGQGYTITESNAVDADAAMLEHYFKLDDVQLVNEVKHLRYAIDSDDKAPEKLRAIKRVREMRAIFVNEDNDSPEVEYGEGDEVTLDQNPTGRKIYGKVTAKHPVTSDQKEKFGTDLNNYYDVDIHDADTDEFLWRANSTSRHMTKRVKAPAAVPTVESWKKSLSSRHKQIEYVKEEKRIIAKSDNRIVGVFPICEEKTVDDGYIDGTLSEAVESIPVNAAIKVEAHQFLTGSKESMVQVEYNGKPFSVPKALIVINILESLNESKMPAMERAIIKKIFEDRMSDKELIKDLSEGLFGEIIGGLTGFALGNKIGEIVAKTLGVGQGILYDLLTSRLFGAAIGSAIGDNI